MQDRHTALRKATESLRDHVGEKFLLREISLSTLDEWRDWARSESDQFDWEEIHRKYNEPDAIKFGIWVDDQLCGLVLGTTSGQSIKARFIEGSPNPHCPLKGRRILIALEALALYGQLRGKRELILEPINQKLISLYENDYGFEVIRPLKGEPFCRKGI
jgi:hypothetical protein